MMIPPDDPLSLDNYASTIETVFRRLVVLYKDGADSGDWMDEAANILSILDADTCAEIIATAKAKADSQ